MIEYTYLEIFLFCAFFVALGYAFKYHEEAKMTKHVLKAMLTDRNIYDKMKADLDAFVKDQTC